MKAFADDKVNSSQIFKFVPKQVENSGERRKCWLPAFSPFPKCFQKSFSDDWMMFYAAFKSISVTSWRQLTLSMSCLGFTSTRLGHWSVLPKEVLFFKVVITWINIMFENDFKYLCHGISVSCYRSSYKGGLCPMNRIRWNVRINQVSIPIWEI